MVERIASSLAMHDKELRMKQSLHDAITRGENWCFTPDFQKTLANVRIKLQEACSLLDEVCDAVSIDEVIAATK